MINVGFYSMKLMAHEARNITDQKICPRIFDAIDQGILANANCGYAKYVHQLSSEADDLSYLTAEIIREYEGRNFKILRVDHIGLKKYEITIAW